MIFFLKAPRSTGESCKNSVGHPRWPHAQRRWAAGKSEDAPTGMHTCAHTHTPTPHTHPRTRYPLWGKSLVSTARSSRRSNTSGLASEPEEPTTRANARSRISELIISNFKTIGFLTLWCPPDAVGFCFFLNKKKLDLRGANRLPGINVRRRPLTQVKKTL